VKNRGGKTIQDAGKSSGGINLLIVTDDTLP
jgi:hypothetical protein